MLKDRLITDMKQAMKQRDAKTAYYDKVFAIRN